MKYNYIEYFENKEDGLASFVFYNKEKYICTGFKDTDSDNMIEIRSGFKSLELATEYVKSLLN